MKQPNMNAYTGSVVRMLKALLVSYVVTGLLLLLIAGLLYRFQLDEGKVQIGIILTYILSCFAGGFLTGKMMKSRQFLWGVLSMIWMYATPIFYPESILQDNFKIILRINPMYHFLKNIRICILDGISPEPVVYIQCLLIALIALTIGLLIFYKSQDRFVLYL